MEEEKKQNSGGVIAVVILSILLILTSGYIVYEKMAEINNEKKDSNKQVTDTTKPVENVVSEETAKKIVEGQLNTFVNYERYLGLDKGVFFDNAVTALDYILSQNTTKEIKQIGNFCGSELEKTLVAKKIIAEKGEGQFACDSTPVYKLSDIKAKAKEYFKDADKLDFTTFDSSSPYYYEATSGSIVVRISGAQAAYAKYVKHNVEGNILNITFTSNDGAVNGVDATYVAQFDIVGSNYYIKSITKVNS